MNEWMNDGWMDGMQEVTEEQVNTDTAYMLFYARKDLCVEKILGVVDEDGGGDGGDNSGGGEGESDEEIDKEMRKMCLLQ